MNEQVVLVNDDNIKLGLADKFDVHTGDTQLHRGFSLFIFNSKGELLLQKRSAHKKTWPNVWSNSVCGHPADDEPVEAAAKRRAIFELGLDIPLDDIKVILSDYRYRYEHLGIVENEICPVMVTFYNSDELLKPNPDEVADYKWVAWQNFLDQLTRPNAYSEWCQEEALMLASSDDFNKFLTK